ncbi:hypothetical protein NM688_g6575 [Phlebia brevispora]|uniref:Uncharacterized protein n=1 Tax=Phlebia brevispora TaxID=194682 RepID=A0ACC1SEI6_9APHY|nr:hypothetical protein NM688_g6575 [Phlebia brevispora]
MTSSAPAPPCVFFLRNACIKGDQCPFSHVRGPVAFGSPRVSVPCSFYLQGKCRNGTQCRFYHPPTQDKVVASPYQGQETSPRATRPTLRYPSSQSGTAARIDLDPRHDPRWNVTHGHEPPAFSPCKFYALGRCTKGDACSFPHPQAPSLSNKIDFVPPKSAPVSIVSDCKPATKDLSLNNTDGSSKTYVVVGSETAVTNADPAQTDLITRSSPAKVVERNIFRCKVTYDDGASIQQITTAFESRYVLLSNLPLNVSIPDLSQLVEKYGDIQNLIVNQQTSSSTSIVRVEYVESMGALKAVSQLNGRRYEGRELGAKMDVMAVEDGVATLRSTKVKLSWFAPSRIAWAHYHGLSFAKQQAERLNGREFQGRKIAASFQTPTYRQKDSFSVEVKGLPVNFSAAQLKGFCHADSVTLGDLPTFDQDEVESRLRRLLEQVGLLDTFEPLPVDPAKPKVMAFAQFTNAEAAEKAVQQLNGTKPAFLGRSPLWLEHVHSIKYTLPLPMFTILKAEIDTLRDHQPLCRIRYYENNASGVPQDPVCVRMYGPEPKSLGKLKAKMDKIVTGDLLLDDSGARVWDAYFGTAEGVFFLKHLSQSSQTFLQSDSRLRCFRLFGSPEHTKTARGRVLQKLTDIANSRHIMPLDNMKLRMLVTGGLIKLAKLIGRDNLALDVRRRTLTTLQAEKGVALQGTCPVCFCDVADAISMPCGHAYCKLCLQHYLRSPPSTNFEGAKCIALLEEGDTGQCCMRAIPLATLQDLLTPGEEDALLQASFFSYVHSRPEEFYYCPTADCQTVYRGGPDGTVLRCPTCFVRICAACHVEFHEGLDCAMYRDNIAGGHDAYNRWREENSVKACPKCKTDIMKDGGCNHMTCSRCGAHICWVCMRVFSDTDSSRGVYSHMAKEHGGFH